MYILGIQWDHDASACLVKDGQIVADVQEERFQRVKHYGESPFLAIEFCLKKAGISIKEVDVIVILESLENLSPYLYEFFGLKGKESRFSIGAPIYVSTYELAKDTKIVCVEHHLAHAASAYYTSGFSGKCLIITADGIGGDGVSLGVWRGENGKIEPLLRVGREGSLGWFYGTVTEALGWRHSDGEGKTMGLAPYGDFSKTEGILNKFCPHYNGGKLVTPHDFGRYKYWKVKGAYHWHFEDAKKIRELLKKYKREDIAAEAQRVFEREMMDIILSWLKKEGTTKLCCSGGAFLNIKLNQRIWESGQVTHQHIFPNAGDGGLPIGQALWAHYYLNGSSEIGVITNVYWGPEFDDKEIKVILKERNLNYKYYVMWSQ